MKTNHKIIHGDSRRMKEVEDESVHLVITSPPYWQLKDYGSEDQVGYNDTYEEYINHLNLVWSESHRILHKGCRLCVNIGDQFARTVYYGRYKVIPIRTEIIKFCENAGFDYMGAIIWQKVTTTNTSGGGAIMGSFPYPRNGILKLDYEFILLFKKLGKPPEIDKEMKKKSAMTKEEWNKYFYGHWNFVGDKQKKHLATFPEELPKRLIKMFSFVGDTVLDPFLGSGTTSLASKNLHRNSIGYELREDFLPIIKEKLGWDPPALFDNADFQLLRQTGPKQNFQEEIKKLPYIFKDPLKVNKIVDPKSFRFGSKIYEEHKKREKYFGVKEVMEPSLVLLSDGRRIRLIGVKSIPGKEEEAIGFLQERTKGTRVFLRTDTMENDDKGNPWAYLYLKNKTFLNAHLIKRGLANVDTELEFRHKKRLMGYQEEREESGG